MTKRELTPELEKLLPPYIAKYTKGVDEGDRYYAFKRENAEKLADWNYKKSGYPKPIVIAVENPPELSYLYNFMLHYEEDFDPALQLMHKWRNGDILENFVEQMNEQFNLLNNKFKTGVAGNFTTEEEAAEGYYLAHTNMLREGGCIAEIFTDPTHPLSSKMQLFHRMYLFTQNIYSNSYCAWFAFIKDVLGVEADVEAVIDEFIPLYMNSNVYSSIFAEQLCIVCKYPKKVYRDAQDRLHRLDGTAVHWGEMSKATEWPCYHIHGRTIEDDLFEKCLRNEITMEEYLKMNNDEQRSAVFEILGAEGMIKLLKAEEIDSTVIVHRNNESERITLYKTKEKLNKIRNAQYAWIRRICPSTGTNYLTPTDPSAKTALEAAKNHRPAFVPKTLPYLWNSRS